LPDTLWVCLIAELPSCRIASESLAPWRLEFSRLLRGATDDHAAAGTLGADRSLGGGGIR